MAQYFKYVRPGMAWDDSGRYEWLTSYMGDPCPVEVNRDVSDWLLENFGGPSGFLRHGSSPTGPLVGACDDFLRRRHSNSGPNYLVVLRQEG